MGEPYEGRFPPAPPAARFLMITYPAMPAMRAIPTTAPMTIPAMAPLLRLLLSLVEVVGAGEVEEVTTVGAGVGAGVGGFTKLLEAPMLATAAVTAV